MMKNKKHILFLLTILFLSSFSLYSQGLLNFRKKNDLSVDFQLRPRAEYRNGYAFPHTQDDKPAGFIVNRSRLSFNYTTKGLTTKMSLQSVNVWGEHALVNKTQNVLIHEAWARLTNKDGLFMKIGRQELHYDDGRLFSACNWNNYGRTHDVLKLGYLNRNHNFEVILGYNQDKVKSIGGTFYSSSGMPYKTMQGFYYKNYSSRVFTPSFIFINLGFDEGSSLTGVSDLRYMQTFGTNLIYKDRDFMLHGVGYYQMGKTNLDNDISAFLLSLKGNYNFDKKISFTIGTDYVSGEDGNSPSPDDTFNAFNVLYSGNHGYYGVMDNYIDNPYINNLYLGIWDKYLKFNYNTAKGLLLTLGYNHLSMAADMYENKETINKYLGSEISVLFNYDIMKNISLSGGYAFMISSESADIVKGGDHNVWQDWGFLSININPTILKTKW